MEILKSAIDTYFNNIYKKINMLCWDINDKYLSQYTLDETVHLLNNIHVYEESLKDIQTRIELALLSVQNHEKNLKNIQKHLHSG